MFQLARTGCFSHLWVGCFLCLFRTLGSEKLTGQKSFEPGNKTATFIDSVGLNVALKIIALR
jgi:hypothetical protein